ncbi:MAG: hypothetical protein IJ482_01630 [Alphaproteobacteria bacterium]|nr:hypothetical protein [Alphaproteobacteria bacterium]
MEKEKWSLKDKFEVAEAIFTIIVSLMAIWGTVIAWENGFWHKLKHIADHLHQEFAQEEINKLSDANMAQEIKKLEQKIK